MRLTLLYFGVLKDILGNAGSAIDLPPETTVAGLLALLQAQTSNPAMQPHLWTSLAVAVNREYARADTVLHPGDEVALLPPVSGGRPC